MPTPNRQSFPNDAAWLAYQAGMLEMAKRDAQRQAGKPKRRTLTAHERKLRRKQQYADWYVLRGGREYSRVYQARYRLRRYHTDPEFRASAIRRSVECTRRRKQLDPTWREYIKAYFRERYRNKRATDPAWVERRRAHDRGHARVYYETHREELLAKARARYAAKKAASARVQMSACKASA